MNVIYVLIHLYCVSMQKQQKLQQLSILLSSLQPDVCIQSPTLSAEIHLSQILYISAGV